MTTFRLPSGFGQANQGRTSHDIEQYRTLVPDPDQAYNVLSASFFNFIGHIEAYFEGRATSIPASIDNVWCRMFEMASDDMDELASEDMDELASEDMDE